MQSMTHELTELLQAWSNGDQGALEKLTPVVYRELHRLARRCMADERRDHTLQATALVNEAYLRLINWMSSVSPFLLMRWIPRMTRQSVQQARRIQKTACIRGRAVNFRQRSGKHSRIHPQPESIDPIGWPTTVARHSDDWRWVGNRVINVLRTVLNVLVRLGR